MTLARHEAATIRPALAVPVRTLAALLIAASLAGGLVGGTIALGIEPAVRSPIEALATPSSFDVPAFRAQERREWQTPLPSFDAVRFRAEERQALP
jgi:hypothetical protein